MPETQLRPSCRTLNDFPGFGRFFFFWYSRGESSLKFCGKYDAESGDYGNVSVKKKKKNENVHRQRVKLGYSASGG